MGHVGFRAALGCVIEHDMLAAFDIPRTRNVLTSLAGPQIWRSSAHQIIALSLLLQIAVFAVLPLASSRWAFLAYFAFWRFSYNAGLGFLLHSKVQTAGWSNWPGQMAYLIWKQIQS